MDQFDWKQIKFQTWDETFRALVPKMRQHSVRVATYSQVLYIQACASSFGKKNEEWEGDIQEKYIDLSYKCGLYHQLGKVLLPPNIQIWSEKLPDHLKASYRTYTSNGRILVSYLQDKNDNSKKKKDKAKKDMAFAGIERPTENVSWLMVRETCEQHMERWDGTGYPNGLTGKEISPMAQIVGLAKEFDRIVCEIKSENPFDDAFAKILSMEGTAFSSELIEVLKACRGKFRGVFRKYIQYANALPKTVSLVDKRPERPMGLKYLKIDQSVIEAVPFFKGDLNDPNKEDSLEQLEPLMIRSKILDEVMFYLIYEVTDTLLRMKNCRIENGGVLFSLPAGFYSDENKRVRFEQVFSDQSIDPSKLLLGVPMSVVLSGDKAIHAVLKDYIESGIQLVIDDYNPRQLDPSKLSEIGFSKMRMASTVESDLADWTINQLKARGIDNIGYASDVSEQTEEELIQGLLLSER